MTGTIYNQLSLLRSCVSFQPLLRLWKEASEGSDTVAARICADLYRKFCAVPELLQPISDYAALTPHQSLIEEAMTTIFPAGFSKEKELNAVAMPFSSKVIYASLFFRQTYLDSNDNYVLPLDPQVEKNIAFAKVNLAYKLILKKWYDIELIGGQAFLCAYPEREHNIHNYFELEWDSRFIDISTSHDIPPLPEDFLLECHHVRDLVKYPELATLLPLDRFLFEGLVITRIREVSERETVNNIRNILQKGDSLENPQSLHELKQQIRYLLRLEEADIGFTAFYDANNEVELPTVNFASILLRTIRDTGDVIAFSQHLAQALEKRPNYFWRARHWHDQDVRREKGNGNLVDRQLENDGWQSALLTALYNDGKVIGSLEIVTSKGRLIEKTMLRQLEHVREILQTAMQQYRQQVQNRITALVKEHFTAVQSSVEWKFNNAAIRYLLQQHSGDAAKMESVVFEQVYPLYGAIDIKNSSGERNRAIQEDLLQQLQWVNNLLTSVQDQLNYPLIQEIKTRSNAYTGSIANYLFAADEQVIQQFLRTEVVELFQYLAKVAPDFTPEIEEYFRRTDNPLRLLNESRQKFEESVTMINNSIVHFLEQEEETMQTLYPHYFERFVTDGVDFNLYIGQSIVPSREYHAVHLKNLRLWQLTFLAEAARQVHRMSASLHLPLQTTQLVLVYNEPISIRFRNAERKFDVDGVHHAHYEILKKRIDKALIKGTNERLTQPGTIAIVYSHDDEAKEYMQYIDYLKTQALVQGTIELLEVEELQSISGLKAIRVPVQLEEAPSQSDPRKKATLND
ncbi:hypothetical protein [Flavisolibacter nicotianae]|uniref:hypothetical protein n=1 Tax=Flavisolibacter nicotianae TaxID=2364882 RepID=UPI000EADAC33|nr:hypothetical protein [Flavisolibacter nicotianae]